LRRIIVCRLLGLVFALPFGLYAQGIDENAMKAAFVYNFALFTEWPADVQHKTGEITLCAESGSPMALQMDALNGKRVKGQRLVVRGMDLSRSDLSPCQILFIDHENRKDWTSIRRRIENASVLTVSDDVEIGADGVIIALSVQNRRLVFDIDMSGARLARLSMSSKLLRLARTVR